MKDIQKYISIIVIPFLVSGCSSVHRRHIDTETAEETKRLEATSVNDEIAKINAMPLAVLDSYYDQSISPHIDKTNKQIVKAAKDRIITESAKLNTFRGVLRASQLSNDISFVSKNQKLAKSNDERKLLEQFAIQHTTDPGRFFTLDFKPHKGVVSTDKVQHAGIFAEHTFKAYQKMYGELTVSRAKHTPGPLEFGQYRLTVVVTLHLPSAFTRRSNVLGNEDEKTVYADDLTVTLNVSPSNMSAQTVVDFGPRQTSSIKRGSRGGFDLIQLTDEPYFTAKITKVEAI